MVWWFDLVTAVASGLMSVKRCITARRWHHFQTSGASAEEIRTGDKIFRRQRIAFRYPDKDANSSLAVAPLSARVKIASRWNACEEANEIAQYRLRITQ
jgi:hypothetical protein